MLGGLDSIEVFRLEDETEGERGAPLAFFSATIIVKKCYLRMLTISVMRSKSVVVYGSSLGERDNERKVDIILCEVIVYRVNIIKILVEIDLITS